MTSHPRTLVVLPALNESQTLAAVLAEVRSAVPYADLLVVDDGSTDQTSEVARALGAGVATLPFNVGVGGAMRTGLRYAHRAGYEVVVQCDADGQHPASAIPELVTGLDGGVDLVVGARFAGVGAYPARGLRRLAMRILAASFSRLHGTSLTDVTSGFRAFDGRAIAVFSEHLPSEYLGDTVEALMIAREAGLVVRQVPVAMRERQGGEPSHSPASSASFLLRSLLILLLSATRLLRRRPAVLP